VAFEVDLQADIPPLEFDKERMEQVLLNLLSNALEASPGGETVFVRTYSEGEQVYLEVIDHGPGISPEERERIFTPFFTTKRYGTGLGLAIVVKIIHAHEGEIQVGNTDKGGATFRVSLPVKNRLRTRG
jgi:signal transduction histidine kinase